MNRIVGLQSERCRKLYVWALDLADIVGQAGCQEKSESQIPRLIQADLPFGK